MRGTKLLTDTGANDTSAARSSQHGGGPTVAIAVDYYQLLGIARNATEDQIKNAVKKAMREWRKRTEAADLSVRQEAELRVRNIDAGREVLTNPTRRALYDQQLGREGVQKPATPQSATGGDWLEKAKEYLGRGDYHSAAYAAREATQMAGNSAEGWWIRSRANAGMNRFDDALYEAQQAAEIDRGNAEYHVHLGDVAEAMERWQQALDEYQEAARLEPDVAMHRLAVGGVYLQNDMPEKAIPIIEAVHRQHPDDENANFYLATALLGAAEEVPARKGNGTYSVTSAAEITKMRDLLRRVQGLRHLPRETLDEVERISAYLARMEKMRFHIPWGGVDSQLAGPVRSAVAVIFGLVVLGAFAFSGLIALFQGSFGGFVFGLISAGGAYGLYRLTWVPQWKVSSRVRRFL
jgi:tetratricopeptide (TPR) repeat protein